MASSWLAVTYQSFIRTHAMFEKYNVTTLTEDISAGSGGEYEVQTGFGWTNGVILDLLDKYGGKMKTSDLFHNFLPTTRATDYLRFFFVTNNMSLSSKEYMRSYNVSSMRLYQPTLIQICYRKNDNNEYDTEESESMQCKNEKEFKCDSCENVFSMLAVFDFSFLSVLDIRKECAYHLSSSLLNVMI
ncbi:hypothetical protein DICVIV_02168 [Dictyocaulus viviparus]|uniref:Trehalase n=1 Tax=Dictyocaulus viviparus TaxID=29172 RepID=A0A0D8Y605_DICVI|nr:hypothetical protein DICVIV_02168 [Dictyocaulus viviparus]